MNTKKGKDVIADSSKSSSEVLKGVAGMLDEAEFQTKIDDLIRARGLSQRDLSELTGIQLSYLSSFILGKTSTINKTHLLSLMAVLGVDSLSDIIEITVPEELKQQFDDERGDWIATKQYPERVADIARLATKLRLKQ